MARERAAAEQPRQTIASEVEDLILGTKRLTRAALSPAGRPQSNLLGVPLTDLVMRVWRDAWVLSA